MKPMAPPSRRAVVRRALKYWRILRAVEPYIIDWKAVAETNRKGTPASAAIARARWVLPVPGGPSKSSPRRGRPPIFVGVLAVGEEEVQGADDFLADAVDSDDVGQPDVDLLRA